MTPDTLAIRRETWSYIRSITQSHRSNEEKLALCVNAATVYAALTGDDSLMPKPVKAMRDSIVEEIPRAMKAAKSIAAEKAKPQGSMFEL